MATTVITDNDKKRIKSIKPNDVQRQLAKDPEIGKKLEKIFVANQKRHFAENPGMYKAGSRSDINRLDSTMSANLKSMDSVYSARNQKNITAQNKTTTSKPKKS